MCRTSGVSHGHNIPYVEGCNCRGFDALPSRLIGTLMRRRDATALADDMRESICATPV